MEVDATVAICLQELTDIKNRRDGENVINTLTSWMTERVPAFFDQNGGIISVCVPILRTAILTLIGYECKEFPPGLIAFLENDCLPRVLGASSSEERDIAAMLTKWLTMVK